MLLNNFARQSSGSQVSGALNQAYYLPSQTVSTYGGMLYSSPIGGGFESALIPSSSVNPAASGAQISAVSMAGQQSVDQYGAINRALPEPVYPGAPGDLSQDPLFMERSKAVLTAIQAAAQQQYLAAPGAATMPAATEPDLEGSETRPASEVQGIVGEGVGTRITGESSEIKNAAGQERSVNGQVSDMYAKLIQSLDQVGSGNEGQNPTAGQEGNAASGPGETPGAPTEIDPLTGQPRSILLAGSAAGTGSGRIGLATGQPGGSGIGSEQTNGRGPGGTSSRGTLSASPTAKRFDTVTDSQLQAGGRVKPVKLAENQDLSGVAGISPFNAMMSRGNVALQAGKYLDAAQAFQAAMVDQPQDPLAAVGRAHAEMGAGMYTSAAFDLKFVFTRKPELMGVKYADVGSFIPAGRQEFLLQDLKKLTTDKDAGGMAAFLYCYLCYQTGRADLLQAELKDWQTLPGTDQWRSVAQRAWGAGTVAK